MTIENVHPGYSVYKQCRIKLLSQAVYYYGSCRQSTTTEPAGSLLLDVVLYCHIYIHYNLDVVLYCHIYTYIWYFEAHFNISNTWCHLNWNWPIFNHCSGIFYFLWTQVLRRSSTCCFTSDVRRVSFVLVLSIYFALTRELREHKPLLYP
jgi:hypothetical protein